MDDSRIGPARVLVIYTGGTVGMKKNEHGSLAPAPGDLVRFVSQMREFEDDTMPLTDFICFEPLLDSSDIEPVDWFLLAELVGKYYYDYDGTSFVVW